MQDAAMLERYTLAHRLGMTLEEVGKMAVSDLIGWREYFKGLGNGKS